MGVRGLWRQGLLGHTRWKNCPEGEKKASSLRFVLSVTEVTAYFSFFLKKKKIKYQVTSVKEEGRQAKHSTNYSGWRKPSTSCKGTNQNNRPLWKRPENALAPSLPLSLQVLTTTLKFMSEVFFSQLGQRLLTLFNSTCSHWCYLTGIFQPFHFTSASYKARSEPAAL